jgi:hypothetical protein
MILVCVFNFIDLFWIFYVKRLLFWNTKAIELSIMAKARILITMPFCYEFESADDDDEYEPSDPRIAVRSVKGVLTPTLPQFLYHLVRTHHHHPRLRTQNLSFLPPHPGLLKLQCSGGHSGSSPASVPYYLCTLFSSSSFLLSRALAVPHTFQYPLCSRTLTQSMTQTTACKTTKESALR